MTQPRTTDYVSRQYIGNLGKLDNGLSGPYVDSALS